MKYNQPWGVSDPDAAYINGNPSTGTMGSIPPAESIEHPQREIVELIKSAGITPDVADLKQLAKGIQRGTVNFGIDAGTVNNLQITMAPVPLLKNGLVARILAVQNNTGPAVLNVNAIGPHKIRRLGDTDLLANDIIAGSVVTMVYNEHLQGGAGAWELQGLGAIGAGGYMTQNINLYVNYNIGNDANDGTANDAAHAVKQIQRAIDIAWSYRPSQYTLTIHVADSQNYTKSITPIWQGPNLVITGNSATPSAVLITADANPSSNAINIQGNQVIILDGLKVVAPAGDSRRQNTGFQIWSGIVTIQNCESGYCDNCAIGSAGQVSLGGSFRFNGNCGNHVIDASSTGSLGNYQAALDVVSPMSAPYFAASGYGFLQFNAAVAGPILHPANFTGKRYLVQQNGIMQTLGGGPNYFPGTAPGEVYTGGQYS